MWARILTFWVRKTVNVSGEGHIERRKERSKRNVDKQTRRKKNAIKTQVKIVQQNCMRLMDIRKE